MKARLATTSIVGLAVLLLISAQLPAQETKTAPSDQGGAKGARSEMHAYLGIAVEPLQPVLARQMPDLKGRGVVIAQVAKGSPAEKAGLKHYDILVSYNEHQLYSPEQLVKLVQHDKSGRDAVLVVISAGKEKKVNVTLGEHHMVTTPRAQQRLPWPMENMNVKMHPNENASLWESFDSMTLTRLDKDRFKAEISYKDDKGKIERRSFEGSRQEIHKAIENQKDLPPAEREQLLRALDVRPRFFDFAMPHLFRNRNGVLWDFEDLDNYLFNDSQVR